MSDLNPRPMRSIAFAIALAGLAACEAVVVESPQLDSPRAAVTTTSTIEAACWAVGVLPASCDPLTCPDAWECPKELDDGWELQGQRMFVDGSNALAGLGVVEDELPEHLRRFCLYRAKAPDLPLGEPKIPASMDCPVVAPQSNVLGKPLQGPLQTAFELHVDAQPGSLVPGPAPVEVAIVDTHSDRASGPASIAHAQVVRRIIETLGCPGGTCELVAGHALALPLDHDGASLDPEDGMYGARAHLALGVVEAVMAFRRRVAEHKQSPRLVVNLSVGWVAKVGNDCSVGEDAPWCGDHVKEMIANITGTTPGGTTSSLIATESLHAALLYASCNGALIVAAAGNARDDSCNDAPVAPGVWGQYRAPTKDECDELGFVPADGVEALLPESANAAWPLVLPVSAERPDGEPIAATRPGSITPLVGPGWHATLDPADDPLTGTSLSAAAVSGAAALVWSHEPELDAGQVVQRLYETGAPSTSVSQLAVHGWPIGTSVRRVSACAAHAPGGSCATSSQLETAVADLAAIAEAEAQSATAYWHEAIAVGLAPDDCDACGIPTVAWIPPAPDATEEEWFFDSCKSTPTSFVFDARSELAGPQPIVPICPSCPFIVTTGDGHASAYLAIDASYLDPSLTWVGANLVLSDRFGKRAVFDLPVSTILTDLAAGDVVSFALPGAWPDVLSARMNAVLVDGRTGDSYVRGNELMLVFR